MDCCHPEYCMTCIYDLDREIVERDETIDRNEGDNWVKDTKLFIEYKVQEHLLFHREIGKSMRGASGWGVCLVTTMMGGAFAFLEHF